MAATLAASTHAPHNRYTHHVLQQITNVRHRKRLTLTLITLCGGLFPPPPASAADEQQRLQQLRSNISELRQGLNTDKEQQTQLQNELKRLEKRIKETNRRLRNTEAQLAQQRQIHQELQSKSLELNQKIEQQKRLLRQQLRASYTHSEQQTLKLLLNQTSPAEAGRTLSYYGYFSRAQLQSIEATRSNISELQATEEKVQQASNKLSALKQQQQQEQNELAERKVEHKVLLGKLDHRILDNERSLATMMADEEALTKLLRELEVKRAKEAKGRSTPDSGKLKGKLQWPAQGTIEHSFGDPRNQGRMTWQGITISGTEGQEIRAIASGKVVFADWMRGYGLLLIIDHSNNLMSLYGYNRTLYKKTGDTVDNNEAIAALGSSDNGNEVALYFELRHKGKPVDPEKWLR